MRSADEDQSINRSCINDAITLYACCCCGCLATGGCYSDVVSANKLAHKPTVQDSSCQPCHAPLSHTVGVLFVAMYVNWNEN